ncbi:transthyretin-like family protein [Calycomorphotria hydatis]|uniref:Nickel uptake substrate-specific transmembrane region n=1 Tax=Calycomorphotria hydatis TaxID=2528027 RepID=A0A517T676_9PLAN|nr:hypothetical protein [Calycomorphotria hydatis]QDT63870.1 hypothetical protein V22_10960 [Calycomorphotria hydatis]
MYDAWANAQSAAWQAAMRCLSRSRLPSHITLGFEMFLSNKLIVTFSLMALAVLAGCGKSDGIELATVRGKVTLSGEPVAGLNVIFQPEQGRPSYGRTSETGEFYMRYARGRDGVLVGESRIYFDPFSLEGEPKTPMNPNPPKIDATMIGKIPQEYFKVFRTETVKSGDNVFEIAIQ